MFGKIKEAVDHVMSLPGPREVTEEILVALNLLIILSVPWATENAKLVDEFHQYVWEKGVKLPCFAPIPSYFPKSIRMRE